MSNGDIWTRNFKGENGGATLLYAQDPNADPIQIKADQWNSFKIISAEHFWIHEGRSYEAGYMWSEGTAIADNANADLVIQVHSAMHVIFDIAVSANCEIRYYTSPTWSLNSPTNEVTAYNKNEYSSNVTTNKIYADPTVSDPGTLKIPKFAPGGVKDAGSGGTGGNFNREKIWKTQSPLLSKLIRVTNRSGGNCVVSIGLEWYEPT